MKKLIPVFASAGLFVPLVALACINVNDTTLANTQMKDAKTAPRTVAQQLRASMMTAPRTAFENATANAHVAESSALELKAVGIVLSGHAADGIALLEALEAEYPGRYSTATNMGTAYELKGDNQKALQWITEGIRRNPDSHEGTEWLHQFILATKLKLAQDASWLKSHHILELDEKLLGDPAYRYKMGDRSFSLKEIRVALLHQLAERMIFVKPRDPVVADLLYTFALVEKSAKAFESASELLKLAGEYGFDVPPTLQAELAKMSAVSVTK
jgi:tetratricopeptide (TPR) repeat protein